MIYIRGVRHEILNDIANELRVQGLWVERHSYSFRIMFKNRVIGSFHVYPLHMEVNVRLYSGDVDVDNMVLKTLKDVFKKRLPGFRFNVYTSPR